MKHEKYNYSTGNVPILKRKIRWNAVFSILMILIILVEVFLMLNAYKNKADLSIIENIVSIVTMIFALSFVLVQLGSIAKNVALINKIKKDGFVQYDTLLMTFDKKTSFGNVFRTSATWSINCSTPSLNCFSFGLFSIINKLLSFCNHPSGIYFLNNCLFPLVLYSLMFNNFEI